MVSRLQGLAILASMGAQACLPGDTRPVPGSVLVATTPSATSVDGVITPDGWTVTFDRVLAGLGSPQLGGDGCNGYSEPRYTRLFDFAATFDGPQKVALIFGLGECDVSYELSPPQRDALLGPGASAADLEMMRVEADDAWIHEPERTGVFVTGSATREGVTKRFEWKFRMEYDIEKCASGDRGQPGTAIELVADVEHQLVIEIDASELLRESADEDAELRFDALADADEDGDGLITLKELDAILAPPPDGSAETGGGDDGPSLADLLYDTLVPRMARPSGSGACEFELDDR